MKLKETWLYIAMLICCVCAIISGAHDKNTVEILWIIIAALWVISSWLRSSEAKFWEEQYHKSDELAGRCIKNAKDSLRLANETQEQNKSLLEAMHFYSDNMIKAVYEIERLDPEGNQVIAEIGQAMYMRKKERDKKMAEDKIDEVFGPGLIEK